MKNNKLLAISIGILTLGKIVSLTWLGYSVQKSANLQIKSTTINSNVLSVSQVASYLGMTEEEVLGIIKTEKNMLDLSGSYTGMMFPYFKVNDKLYFYKEQIDEWIKEASTLRKEYDTKNGYVF